jgi:hypothetical protein
MRLFRRFLTGGQLHDLAPGDTLQRPPIELLEGLYLREAPLLEAPLGGALFPGAQLGLQQLPQEILIVPPCLCSLTDEAPVPGGRSRPA